ncbi:1344_t:CDS:2 [Funneliformis mosseae]|uniref:1344_t:CDS:1 n=1 Tax=Funneliformis mosseae TaxID=27381 RepID=A0A9N9DKK3_FUNMO|nr:1344_t:CDS:2 [Funneliformis mosseae]
MVTSEKDIWTASDVNIHETLTPLDHSILFLDGRALESIVGHPDFIIEKESLEGSFVCSNDDPINQTYGYMCTNSLRYGVLSTYDQTWFLKRGIEKVEDEDYGCYKYQTLL